MSLNLTNQSIYTYEDGLFRIGIATSLEEIKLN